jgi:hypothetical protein
MVARIRQALRAWRERRRQYAIDRALYKMGRGRRAPSREAGAEDMVDRYSNVDGGDAD